MPRTRILFTASAVLATVLAVASVSSLSGAGDATAGP